MAKPRNLYIWKTRQSDGTRRQVKAHYFGAQWTLSSRCDGEEDWTTHPQPMLEDLRDLEETVFNKYQRKHTSWDILVGVRKLIAKMYPAESEAEE